MNQRLRVNSSAEGGFTLIELIVVIVILGILAATALPKFASLGGDARLAALQAAKGSLSTVSAMAHGKYLLNSTLPIVLEDKTLNMTNGYPKADQTTAEAAGLSISTTGTGVDFAIATTAAVSGGAAAKMTIVPASLASKIATTKCAITYTESAAAGTPPTIVITSGAVATDCE